MNTAKAIHLNSTPQHLDPHISSRPNTIVDAESYIGTEPTGEMTVVAYADLLIAFDATLKALADSNAYVVSEQGKQPDSVLEVASEKTLPFNWTTKQDIYPVLEVAEYWRFDEMPIDGHPSLAGRWLDDGEYRPITIEQLEEGALQAYSATPGLLLRWVLGQLR